MSKFKMSEKRIREILHNWGKSSDEYVVFMNLLDENEITYETMKSNYRVYNNQKFGKLKVLNNDEVIFDGDEYYSDVAILSIIYSYFME